MFRIIKETLRRGAGFLYRRRGDFIYYGLVLLALAGMAWGAEAYRIRKNAQEEIAVPATEILQVEEEAPAFLLPEGMSLLQGYSDQPLWNGQAHCWQAHPAADYVCEGGLVCALAAGTVEDVGKSGVLGGYVQVRSGDVLLKYCCLQPLESIAVGAFIDQGEILGEAQNAMPGETQLGEHLHLEASREAENLDPASLLQGED